MFAPTHRRGTLARTIIKLNLIEMTLGALSGGGIYAIFHIDWLLAALIGSVIVVIALVPVGRLFDRYF